MKTTFWPVSKHGKWAVILAILNLLAVVAGFLIPRNEEFSGFDILLQNPLLAVITVLMFLIGIAVTVLAVISIKNHKERSILVFLALLAGFYSIAGFLGTVVNLYLMTKFTL